MSFQNLESSCHQLPPIRNPNHPTIQKLHYNNIHNNQQDEEKIRYARLQKELRPSSLLTTVTTRNDPSRDAFTPIGAEHRRSNSFGNLSDSGSIDSFDSLSLEQNSTASGNGDASLVFSSSLKLPAIVIPESRIKTPKTPKIPTPSRKSLAPSSSSTSEAATTPQCIARTRTRSPSDEMFLGNVSSSPSQYLITKYKSNNSTPKYRSYSSEIEV